MKVSLERSSLNLKDKTIADFTIENLQPHQKPEEIQVLITPESSIDQGRHLVSAIGMGFIGNMEVAY